MAYRAPSIRHEVFVTSPNPLFTGETSGITVSLFSDGSVRLRTSQGKEAQGRLDTVVLREWNEAHLVDCEARLDSDPDENEALLEDIDDLLSAALQDDPGCKAGLQIPRSREQVRELVDLVGERLTAPEKAQLLKDGPGVLTERLAREEFLSLEQARTVLEGVLRDLRDL
jgi:hypothetical protein